jgi:RNA polymerase sigma factor (sigma-70 family)
MACQQPCADSSSQAGPAAVAAQDRSAALAEIARNHHSALVRFLALRTGSAEDAKEIAQEAYAKVLALDRPGAVSFLVGYLWRIAANLAIDRSRQRVWRARASDGVLPSGESAAPSTERVVELHQRLAIVEIAISELPTRCRQAFLLRIVEGLRYGQVGKAMGITDRMAKIHVARAMEYLQHRLDSAESPGKPK